jgi:Flp pilus assembly protein TadB
VLALVSIALAGVSGWLLLAPSPAPRIRRVFAPPARRARATSLRTTRLAAAVGGAGLWVVLGGWVGAAAGVACVVLVPRAVARLESASGRRRREELERQAPLLADLLAAMLAGGATLRAALAAAGDAVGEPTAGAVRDVVAAVDLGAEPIAAWRGAGPPEVHQPVIDAVERASTSGAPVAHLLTRIADDLRRERAVQLEVAARSAGVRAVAPLAACFLPAFILVGVVPVVASLATGLLAS